LSSGSVGDGTPGLLVPIDVQALCVGDGDAAAARGLAGATANFQQQWTPEHQAFIGANVTIEFDDPPLQVLEPGVHLHWALPDALTHADTSQGKLTFPAVPNRWLVTRIVLQDDQPLTRSWLVESDAVLPDRPDDRPAATIAVKPGTFAGQDFGWIGRVHDVAAAWDPDSVSQAPTVLQVTGGDLTAVTNGELSFAAYYPSCRSVFGFHDALSDLTPPAGETATLTYAVAGWYAEETKDVIRPGATLESVRRLGWTYAGDAAPAYSVCHGLVEGIAWSPTATYLPSRPPALAAEVAIGTTPAEALAAYFANRNHPDIPLAERLLDGLQLGLLDDFTQPAPNRLIALNETLHDRGFARASADPVFAVVVPDPAAGKGAVKELVGLPPALAASLNRLNDLRDQLERCRRHVDWYRWQLFADWYRIFQTNSATHDMAVSAAEQRLGGWDELQGTMTALGTALASARTAVETQLSGEMQLAEVAGQEYVQPADPAVMLIGAGVGFPPRYGGDGRHDPDGRLVCRLTGDLLSSLSAGGKEVDVAAMTAVSAPGALPHSELLTSLLREACVLDTALASARTAVAAAALDAALALALEGHAQSTLTLAGTPPSPVAVSWFDRDEWLPLLLGWSASWLPFHDTGAGAYPASTITGGFVLDPNGGGTLTPIAGGPDPAQPIFPQQEGLTGVGHLTPRSAEMFAAQLKEYLAGHPDTAETALKAILDELERSEVVTASLAGLTQLMVMRRHGLQLPVRVPDGPPQAIQQLTQLVAATVGDANSIGPALRMAFNPLRAGYLRVSLKLVDAYGRKRDVKAPQLVCSQPLTAVGKDGPVASTAYLAPRLSQPSRLAFRWLAADGTGLDEMNDHPAMTPICGWLLPNRLDGSLFVYSASGSALGMLYLQQTSTGASVQWQSAPGDERTIGRDVEQALAHANPRLLELAVSLRHGSAAFFEGLWRAIDAMADTIAGGTPPSNAGMATLVGRPVALAETLLRVELQGAPMLDIGFGAFENDTDDGLGGIKLPVVLGDLGRLSDGLIGFFAPVVPGGTYDLHTFYTQAADGTTSGIVVPAPDTVSLQPTPRVGGPIPPDVAPDTRTVLMLLDPAAPVHATAGVLPTAALGLAADQVADALSTLDMSFFAAPVLGGAAELAMPTPVQPGYGVSWVEEGRTERGALTWLVTPEIADAAGRVVWPYTPQTVREGWLRLNPLVLEFHLAGVGGQPVVRAGRANDLTLTVRNAGRRDATFRSCSAVPESVEATGSIFYVHLGALLAPADAATVTFTAAGWSFTPFSDRRYGIYWAATPAADVTVPAGGALSIQIGALTVTSTAARAHVPFDYYGVDGLDDGVAVEIVAVQTATVQTATGR
jgi:hypothetical protein